MQRDFGGRQVELANALERSPSYISRVLSPQPAREGSHSNRNIGEELARDIERRLDLPIYSLDQPEDRPQGLEEPKRPYHTHQYDQVSEEHRRCVDNMANAMLRMTPEQAKAVEKAIRLLLRARTP